MRLAAYAGASTVLAGGVIVRAFVERPNFYSATVYLGQSNACRMILLNFLLFSVGSTVFALQRLLYGRLRPIEFEQLWDKAWYAITETALAMTTFRDEVGGWFFIMFMSLLAGKVWGWIGEGRVEILEQQPPTNPRLFHSRLIVSLIISNFFDALMLRHCMQTLAAQPKPGMMVMFAFEFAVLTISSISTLVRYTLALNEIFVVQQQTKMKLKERREEIRATREDAERRVASGELETLPPDLEREEDVDEVDIDVPGWQEKGRWVLFLDLTTDFLKLVLYMVFFTILFLFSGIPIHMFRDLFITTRSFFKRISDYLKYRNATKDMHARYPDATEADLERDGTCIVCREEMHVWRPQNANSPRHSSPDERQRPKKLPCGHILHFACLRSWLERQQVCPTCRRSVLAPPTGSGAAPADRPAPPAPQGLGNGQEGRPPGDQGQDQRANGTQRQPPNGGRRDRNNQARTRTINLPGGFRVTLATGNPQQVRNAIEAMHADPNARNRTMNNPLAEALHAVEDGTRLEDADGLQDQIQSIERRITRQITDLNVVSTQLQTVRALQGELARLRISRASGDSLYMTPGAEDIFQQPDPPFAPNLPFPRNPPASLPHNQDEIGMTPHIGLPFPGATASTVDFTTPDTLGPGITGSSSVDLPEGLNLPEGWSIIPLQRIGGPPPQHPGSRLANDQRTASEPVHRHHGHSLPGNQAIPASVNDRPVIEAQSGRQDTAQPSRSVASRMRSASPQADGIPKWSSSTSVEPLQASDDEPHAQQGSADRSSGNDSEGKGKARAVTVEDPGQDDEEDT